MEAWTFLREKNNSIPDETLDFMREASIQRLRKIKKATDPSFDIGQQIIDIKVSLDLIKEKTDDKVIQGHAMLAIIKVDKIQDELLKQRIQEMKEGR